MSPLWWPLNQFVFYCFRIVFVQFIYRIHVHLDHHGEGGGVGDPETLSAIFVANFRMGTKIQGGKGIILTNLSRVSPFKEFHKTWPFVQWMKKLFWKPILQCCNKPIFGMWPYFEPLSLKSHLQKLTTLFWHWGCQIRSGGGRWCQWKQNRERCKFCQSQSLGQPRKHHRLTNWFCQLPKIKAVQ